MGVCYSFHFLRVGTILDALSHLALELQQAPDEVFRLGCCRFHFSCAFRLSARKGTTIINKPQDFASEFMPK
jgi:hypothetical protein